MVSILFFSTKKWDIVKEGVVRFANEFHFNLVPPIAVTYFFIALNPKSGNT